MAAPLLLRGLPFLRRRHHHYLPLIPTFLLRLRAHSSSSPPTPTPTPTTTTTINLSRLKEPPPPNYPRVDEPEYNKWKGKEALILQDVDPIIQLTKHILHSQRYMDGERLTVEDEKAVIEKLLAHHPHSEDKIGCGLDSIMVDRHPQFKHSRCLFVVRTDGGWIDFSYQKCLRAYIRHKYPAHAERFIKEHFKRGSS